MKGIIMELIENMYNLVNSSTIIMKAKFEIEITPETVNGITIFDTSTYGTHTVYGILFKTEMDTYIAILPDFLKLDDGFAPCGQAGKVKLMYTIYGNDEDEAIKQFEEIINASTN